MYNQWLPAANRLLAMEGGDRGECERLARSRKTAVNIAKRAQMLVLAARGLSNRQIALELGANEHVVGRVRKEYNQRGLAVLEDRARPGRPRSSRDQQSVQKVVETVCQAPAKGLSRWSARTLAGHLDIPLDLAYKNLEAQKAHFDAWAGTTRRRLSGRTAAGKGLSNHAVIFQLNPGAAHLEICFAVK